MSEGVRLSRDRILSVGIHMAGPTYSDIRPYLLITDRTGQLVFKTTFAGQLPGGGFAYAASLPQRGAIVSGGLTDSLGPTGQRYSANALFLVDSLGVIQWQRSFDPHWGAQWGGLAARPAGVVALLSRSRQFNPTVRTSQGILRHVDMQGLLQWEQVVGAPYSNGGGVAALPDGSYVTVMNDPSRRSGIQNRWAYDYKLNRFSPNGQRLDSTWIGRTGDYDRALQIKPTTDGGLVLVGTNDENLPNTPERSILIKLDSTFREQWRVVESAPGMNSGTLSDWHLVQEMVGGHYLVGGLFSTAAGLGRVAPPATPTDSVGTLLWADPIFFRNAVPVGLFFEPGSGGLGQVVGRTCGGTSGHAYFAGATGLGVPVTVNLCATPPPAPRPTFSPPMGSTIAFALDPLTTPAGPRYAVVDEVEWDFGDNSPPATGWRVTHAYASPQPVTVRCCITNNLFCRTCTDVYPLGTSDAVGPAEVSVFPNPSASGRYTVRLGSGPVRGATLTVLDAVGRVVAHQASAEAETSLDLGRQPAGVYVLRVTRADGRSLTCKLVR